MTKDLTEGNSFSLIISFTIPLLFGYLFQQFYNVVDTIIVGKCLGVEALAAVGSTGAVNFLIIGFVMGLCTGFAIPVTQRFGAKDFSKMRKYISNTLYLCIAFSVLMAILTVIFCRPLLLLMQTPQNIVERAAQYIVIIFAGIPVIFLYNMTSGIIRALGDSKTPVYFLVLSSFLNIGLDLLFIITFKWDVGGAALATVISQGISGLACLIYMKKKFDIIRTNKEERTFDVKCCLTLCGVGVPMGLQYSITAIGSVIMQTSVNMLGSDAVAACTAAGKVSAFFCTVFDALGTTAATYSGQNTGAGKISRLPAGVRDSMIIATIYSILVFGLFFFAGDFFIKLFMSGASDSIIKDARLFLLENAAFYITLAAVNIFRFTIQGMGFSRFAIISGVMELIARSLMGIFMVPKFGFVSAGFASPLAWIFADMFLIPAFIGCLNKLKKHFA